MLDLIARGVDRAAAQQDRQARQTRADQERMVFLYSRLFRNVTASREVVALRSEAEARQMFSNALATADNRLQVEILRAAVDKRWASIVTAFIKVWHDEHPIGKTVDELWTLVLTTGRAAV